MEGLIRCTGKLTWGEKSTPRKQWGLDSYHPVQVAACQKYRADYLSVQQLSGSLVAADGVTPFGITSSE